MRVLPGVCRKTALQRIWTLAAQRTGVRFALSCGGMVMHVLHFVYMRTALAEDPDIGLAEDGGVRYFAVLFPRMQVTVVTVTVRFWCTGQEELEEAFRVKDEEAL